MPIGVERGLLGKQEGDEFSLTVLPEQAYGLLLQDTVQRVPLKHLQTYGKPVVGDIAQVHTESVKKQVVIMKLGKFNADVDFNHPLAGKTLLFDIEVVSVRDATPEELSHGHAHGEGGHHH